MSEEEMVEFTFAEIGWDAGSLGIGDAIDLTQLTTLGGATAVSLMSFGSEAGLGYAQYYYST